MTTSPRISKLAVGLAVAGGVIWTVAGVVFGVNARRLGQAFIPE